MSRNTIADANLYGAKHFPEGYIVLCDYTKNSYYAVPIETKKENLNKEGVEKNDVI
jgi:hypothetical protein